MPAAVETHQRKQGGGASEEAVATSSWKPEAAVTSVCRAACRWGGNGDKPCTDRVRRQSPATYLCCLHAMSTAVFPRGPGVERRRGLRVQRGRWGQTGSNTSLTFFPQCLCTAALRDGRCVARVLVHLPPQQMPQLVFTTSARSIKFITVNVSPTFQQVALEREGPLAEVSMLVV